MARPPYLAESIVLLGLLASAPSLAQTQLASVSTFGNFQTGGVLATISGDTDGDATATLEYRLVGDPTFRPAQPLNHPTFVPPNNTRLVGSLFGLSPGTSYEVRVTVVDPDGVGGTTTMTAGLATRVDSFPEPTMKTLYVSPSGNDTNPGTAGQPLGTIQGAESKATAGTLVLIQPGIYREEVTVDVAGNSGQPIVFRGNAPGVILDGADAAIAAGVPWTNEGGGVFARVLGFSTYHVVTELGRLYQYFDLADLQALGAGFPGGFFFDGTTLRVKLADGSSPAAHTMYVGRLENGFHLTGAARFVRIENVEIRYYGSDGFGKGVYLNRVNDSAVRGCRIHEVQSAGVWIKAGSGHVVEDNVIWDTSIFGWPWPLAKGSSAEGNGVAFTNDVGRGNVVRRNTIDGTFNGIGPCGSTAIPEITNETDVHNNTMSRHLDDAFEPEGYCSNVRLFENRIRDVHMAFAVAPANPGPTYIVRNVAYNFGNTRASQIDDFTSSALKVNSGFSDPIGPLFLYHNTFLTEAPNTSAMALLSGGSSTFVRARNNLFAGTDYALYKTNTIALDWNSDDLYTTPTDRLVRWHTGAQYATLTAFRTGTNLELQGISAPPALVNPAGGLYQPADGSPLIDAGTNLANLNDDAIGAPDIGAIEVGTPPSPPTDFYTLTPCRLVDTRNAAGPLGGPQIWPYAQRVFPLAGVCGVPIDAKALVLNVTVVGPSAGGHIRLFPGNQAPPLARVVSFSAGQTRASLMMAKMATNGAGTLALMNDSPGSLHVILDVTGYFR